MKIDLHLHTTASDGLHSPGDLLDLAVAAGLTNIAITDHESVEGYLELAKAERPGIRIIPGVELLVTHNQEEVHLLGYGLDPQNREFLDRLAELRAARNAVALEQVHKLQKLGFPLSWDAVTAVAHPRGAVGKGHIVHALRQNGLLASPVLDFVKHYLNPAGLAHVEFQANSFDEGVELIRHAGGIPVIAHPALIANQSIIPELIKQQKIGIEVFYFYYGPSRQQWVKEFYIFAQEQRLLMTGGSDYHGPFAPFKLGDLEVPAWVLTDLENTMQKC
ncbi:MAG: PHP domain-containing protein [Heliobacteriaceae bacterium]|nr:PHP domain-containing protein [Heliobacteriaceae bacterium]